MSTPEVIHLKSGITIAVLLKLAAEETGTKTQFWLVKIKWDNAKHSLSLSKRWKT